MGYEKVGKKMALTNRGKNLVRSLAVGSLLVVIGAGFSAVSASGSTVVTDNSVAHSYITVIVAPGETIWSIAASSAHGRSVSDLVDQIIADNHLAGTDVAAGRRLLVPIK